MWIKLSDLVNRLKLTGSHYFMQFSCYYYFQIRILNNCKKHYTIIFSIRHSALCAIPSHVHCFTRHSAQYHLMFIGLHGTLHNTISCSLVYTPLCTIPSHVHWFMRHSAQYHLMFIGLYATLHNTISCSLVYTPPCTIPYHCYWFRNNNKL